MVDSESVDLSALRDVPAETWERLASRRVYFGHQSVGADVVAGIEEICKAVPSIRLRIVESPDLSQLDRPGFAHSPNGRNCEPESKISEFVQRIESAGAARPDVAFFKFCYVDVGPGTDVGSLFSKYDAEMSRLERQFPGTTFVHVTVPLTTPQSGPKAALKRLAGRLPAEWAENGAREEFNELLRGSCRGRRPLIDLAAAESTLPDGSRATFRMGDRTVPCLARCYTSDGGHLNAAGRRVAGREVLLSLAELMR